MFFIGLRQRSLLPHCRSRREPCLVMVWEDSPEAGDLWEADLVRPWEADNLWEADLVDSSEADDLWEADLVVLWDPGLVGLDFVPTIVSLTTVSLTTVSLTTVSLTTVSLTIVSLTIVSLTIVSLTIIGFLTTIGSSFSIRTVSFSVLISFR